MEISENLNESWEVHRAPPNGGGGEECKEVLMYTVFLPTESMECALVVVASLKLHHNH